MAHMCEASFKYVRGSIFLLIHCYRSHSEPFGFSSFTSWKLAYNEPVNFIWVAARNHVSIAYFLSFMYCYALDPNLHVFGTSKPEAASLLTFISSCSFIPGIWNSLV